MPQDALLLPPLAGARPKAAAAEPMALPAVLGPSAPVPTKPTADAPPAARPPLSGSLLKFPQLVKPLQRPAGVSASGSSASLSGNCNQEEERGLSPLPRTHAGSSSGNHEPQEDGGDGAEDKTRARRSQRSAVSSSGRRSAGNNSDAGEGPGKAAAHAKNRDFIKELEDKKRREREDKERRERRHKKKHDMSTHKILQEAALKKQQQQQQQQSPEHVGEVESAVDAPDAAEEPSKAGDDAADRERKERARREQKKLLKKQQRLLDDLQAKKREKEEEAELERERERKRQEKVTRAILSAIQDANQKEDQAFAEEAERASHQGAEETLAPSASFVAEELLQGDEAEEQKRRAAKEQLEAMRRKQQEYLAKLAEQRRQKQREEHDARALQERKKKKTQQEAARVLEEAARRRQQEQEARERQLQAAQEASAAAAAAAPPVDVEAMVARLSRLKERDALVVPEARDFASWKKRHGVRADQKVFIVTGCYPVVREELEKRGWFCNPERASPFFDLKWALKSDDLKSGGKLEKHQFVNHFAQNTAVTTKVGLLHSLRRAAAAQSFDGDAFFPRAFDLNEPSDMDAFVQDFRFGVAEGLLKQLVGRLVRLPPGTEEEEKGATALAANQGLLDVVLAVARSKVRSRRPECQIAADGAVLPPSDLFARSSLGDDDPLEDSLDAELDGPQELVTDLQWEVLSTCALDRPGKLRASLVYVRKVLADDKTSGVDAGGASEGGGAPGGGPSAASVVVDTVLTAMDKKQQRRQEKRRAEAFQRDKARLAALVARVEPVSCAQQREAERLVRALAALCPQFHINGGAEALLDASQPAPAPSQNVWIVKPAGLSRGRGIRVFKALDELLGYADVETHKECQWVAQKYIESPLLVCRRKFDIRQWVLVTCWDPLTVWMHADCYLRFSSEEYSTADLSDQFVHLTNNSIQKHSDKFHDVYATDDGAMTVEGNMWHSDDFRAYLARQLQQPDVWEAQLRPAMRAIVVRALQSVQDRVAHRTNACELFGYDFMLDDRLTPWLIEVNSSPACDYSTPTAERYVTEGLSGVIKVIVDLREFEETRKRAGGAAAAGSEPDTGCWTRIHRGEFVGKPVAALGADLQVRGAKLSRAALRRQVARAGASDGGAAPATGDASSAAPSAIVSGQGGDGSGGECAGEEGLDEEEEDRSGRDGEEAEAMEGHVMEERAGGEEGGDAEDEGEEEEEDDDDDDDELSQTLDDSLL